MLFSVCGCDARGEHGSDTRGNMVVVQGGNMVMAQGGNIVVVQGGNMHGCEARGGKKIANPINENENHTIWLFIMRNRIKVYQKS